MKDITLKFKNETEMKGGLALLGYTEKGMENPEIFVDVIGVTYDISGTLKEPIFTEKPGYFVNLRILDDTDTSMLDKYVVVLDPPLRVWANTVTTSDASK